MRTIFIGDVHGCFDELMELFALLKVRGGDRVLFTGDLINKGPKSLEVVELVKAKHYQTVMGNHEYKLLSTQNQDGQVEKKIFGSRLPASLMNWISNIPYFIEDENFLLVHAGFNPKFKLSGNDPATLITIRKIDDTPWHELYQGSKPIIYGHWAQQRLSVKPNSIGLDSGCVYGGELTAYVLEENKFVQVKAKRVYCPIGK